MTRTRFALPVLALGLLALGSLAHAASITGTVTNKTTGKPAAGDVVVLVNPMTGMSEVARTTTDARGHYTLQKQGEGPALIRALHQGAEYFIEAPKSGVPADISVYDVAAKVDGVSIIENVYGIVEAQNGHLHVVERWMVQNTATPPRTQWTSHSFEVILPEGAVVQEASAQRPGGLPTTLKLDSTGVKNHYSFDFPIQPDDGDKHTMFQVEYQIPYSDKFTFHPTVTLPAHTVWVVLPKSISISSGAGSNFQSSPQDPSFQTFVARDAQPGKPLEFTIAGNGALPRDQQAGDQSGDQGGQQDAQAMGKPGGGLGNPIATPDPLSKYKWWILGGLGLLLVVAAAFLLRQPASAATVAAGSAPVAQPAPPSGSTGLLNALKEEIFALESDRVHGKVSEAEYAQIKAALEIVLKRALKHNS
ncbi:MAG: carboxypeptidase-like regulatory domain-containing protein [Terracidiphilus sp.]